jgi:hypothetical protein
MMLAVARCRVCATSVSTCRPLFYWPVV